MLINPSIESAIEANPNEATNHLAYADWLDENGEPEEAAFRRAMGEWLSGMSFKGRGNEQPETDSTYGVGDFPYRINPSHLPSWAPAESIATTRNGGSLIPATNKDPAFQFGSSNRFAFLSRDHMENVLRRSWNANRHRMSRKIARASQKTFR